VESIHRLSKPLSPERRRFKPKRWQPYVLLACLMALAARQLHISHWRWGAFLDTLALDQCFEMRGPLPTKNITDDLWPTKEFILVKLPSNTTRPILAKIIRQFRQAKVVAVDLMLVDQRAELTPIEVPLRTKEMPIWAKENADLAQAMHQANNVVLGIWPEVQRVPIPGAPGKTTMQRIWQYPPPALWKAARYRAHLWVEPSVQDGITRHVRLFEDLPAAPNAPVSSLPSFSLAVAGAAEGLSQQQIQALATPHSAVTLKGRRIARYPRDLVVVDYLGRREAFDNNAVTYDYAVALNEDLWLPEDFAGKIVFIGRTDYKAKDDFTTPFGDMPGVHVHMHATATLLRPSGPPLALALWQTTAIALLCSLLLILPLLRLSLWGSLIAALLLCLLVFLGCAYLFTKHHRFFPISVPIIAIALTYNGIALYEYGRARATLARFVGSDMAGAMLNPLHDLKLGGKSEMATAFFCDLRKFTAAAEHIAPETLEPLVNAYTEKVSEVVSRYEGRIIDYFGDGVFVLFRGPGDHAFQAVCAALAVQKETQEVIVEWSRNSGVDLEIAIGINTGEMAVGVVGSQDHMKIGAVGDAVNVASRVQTLTARCGFQILVTKECYDIVDGRIPMLPCGSFEIKGREKPVAVFGAGETSHSGPSDSQINQVSLP
jgi:class 3 adenylate cyclase/CHASE2 domain-containing sensor protein